MSYCIYCKSEEQSVFQGREHVIPEAFGTFESQTPTLKCVCDNCNAYFGMAIDQNLARETIEGVARYRNGKFSKENRRQRKLRISLDQSEETGEFKGVVLDGVDPATGNLRPPRAQLHVKNLNTGQTEVYFRESIATLALTEDVYGETGARDWKVFAASKEDHDAFVTELLNAGHLFRPDKRILPVPQPSEDDNSLPVVLQGEVDDLHKRALAKILVNCAASEWGPDEFRKSEWQPLLEFIRYGTGELGVRRTSKPFWGDETSEWRFLGDSISMCIDNTDRGVMGAIQFYGDDTYQLLLNPNVVIANGFEFALRFTPGRKPMRGEKRPVISSA